jgi:Cdc6-like AAA superfamily ATPase
MTANPRPQARVTGLMDRQTERDALDRLVEAVWAGESRALVVRGDPGVGKTVLLDHMASWRLVLVTVRNSIGALNQLA